MDTNTAAQTPSQSPVLASPQVQQPLQTTPQAINLPFAGVLTRFTAALIDTTIAMMIVFPVLIFVDFIITALFPSLNSLNSTVLGFRSEPNIPGFLYSCQCFFLR